MNKMLKTNDVSVSECAGRAVEAVSNHTYSVIRIPDFETAQKYEAIAPDWCIVYDKESFYLETLKGTAACYVLARDDYQTVPRCPESTFPYDNYGMSFICVMVDEQGEMFSCTSRWNDVETMDVYLTAEQVKALLPDEYEHIIQ